MAEDVGDKIAEGKLDLVPMIDCIMLLLLFFLLTSKFTSEEKAITSMLPTDKGQAMGPSKKVDPPKQINIAIYPTNLPAKLQPADYGLKLKRIIDAAPRRIIPDAMVRVGGNPPIPMQGNVLAQQGSTELKLHMDQIHNYVQQSLEAYDKKDVAERKDQFPVVIHCFSGLSWKFALVAYDAVREFERKKGGFSKPDDPRALEKQREVDFAPPRIRNYSTEEMGNEIYEIINLLI